MKNLLLFAFVAWLAWFGYGKYKAIQDPTQPLEQPVTAANSPLAPSVAAAAEAPSAQFSCDGRTHCSQMRSCAEATYFIQHCPNTKMDGNNDGEPCEQQWCN